VYRVLSVSKSPVSAMLLRTMPLVMVLLVGGCISPHSAPPEERALENPANLGLSGAPAPVPDPEWWTAYQDPQLDRLLRGALADNPTLAQSRARVRAAQAEAAAVHADLYPSITWTRPRPANGSVPTLRFRHPTAARHDSTVTKGSTSPGTWIFGAVRPHS
jgi:outer membrane protein TolC